MQVREGRSSGAPDMRRLASVALIAAGALVVAVQLRIIPLLLQGLTGWLGPAPSAQAPISIAGLSSLETFFDGIPWLPWALWLIGAALLPLRPRPIEAVDGLAQAPPARRSTLLRSRWLAGAVLLVLLLLGGYARMSVLWPQSTGISQLPYDDEGVYAGTSQLFLQGILPYRDYFFAHPPIAAISYAPAMAYHFTEWGSPTSFMMARYLSVAYSLLTLALLFLIGYNLAGLFGGTLVGLLWAVDGRVVEINRKIMLDGPMVLFSCAAILLYLWSRPRLTGPEGETPDTGAPRRRVPSWLLFGLTGVFAALSGLTKIAGLACLAAILADLGWIWLENRRLGRQGENAPNTRTATLSLLGGTLLTVLVVLTPFLIAAGSQFVRMVFFFQVLRPADGIMDVALRVGDITSTLANGLTPLFAGLGFMLISVWVLSRLRAGPWRLVALWAFLSLLLFTYSRSFYGHYYIQLAAPLCILGGGVGLLPELLGRPALSVRRGLRQSGLASAAALALFALPLVATTWTGITTPHNDRIFEIVGRYVSDAVSPGTQVLTTDEQFNFLAARPPSRNSTGYLIDSYGHMIFLGLGLNTRSWGDLWADVFTGKRSNDAYAVMRSPVPQSDILDRAAQAPLAVVHDKGYSRLTPATVATLESEDSTAVRQARYTIYRKK